MATATMGLRRRVPVNNSPSASSQSPSSNKRSRSENNNSPSQGNLNSLNGSRDEPPAKKSRGTSTVGSKASSMASDSGQTGKNRAGNAGSSVSKSSAQTKTSPVSITAASDLNPNALSTAWSTAATPNMPDGSTYASVTSLNMTGGQASLCAGSLNMPTPIPYMATSMATFVGNATNLGKSSSVSYLDISNMTGGSLNTNANAINPGYIGKSTSGLDMKNNVAMQFAAPTGAAHYAVKNNPQQCADSAGLPKNFQNDSMFNTYQPWVIKTYGDLAKTKTITIKKYARILRTLRGEEVNSAENSKFRFWVKSKGFHVGQPEGYDAKPADRIIGRHAVTSPGLDPPLYVPTQLPHNKALNGAEGTVPGRVYKKVAIVENFFDIIHAVHVDLEGRPGKHAGQKRTYRTITETYAFLPREAVTRFLLGCTECQRRPRTPSPTNLSNQSQSAAAAATPLSPTPATTLSASPVQTALKPREASHAPESKSLFSYRHPKHQKIAVAAEKPEKEEKYNPLSITNLLKKESTTMASTTTTTTTTTTTSTTTVTTGGNSFSTSSETLTESRRTPESDRASSRSSASSKRKRMLPEGRTPSPQPTLPLPRPWSPGLDPKNTPIDYSLPITTTYLKHQQRLEAEKRNKLQKEASDEERAINHEASAEMERERFSPAAGLIDTNLNLLATIQHLHCQVMLALTERLRHPSPLALQSAGNILPNPLLGNELLSIQAITARNNS